jgi:hypothetical protein
MRPQATIESIWCAGNETFFDVRSLHDVLRVGIEFGAANIKSLLQQYLPSF